MIDVDKKTRNGHKKLGRTKSIPKSAEIEDISITDVPVNIQHSFANREYADMTHGFVITKNCNKFINESNSLRNPRTDQPEVIEVEIDAPDTQKAIDIAKKYKTYETHTFRVLNDKIEIKIGLSCEKNQKIGIGRQLMAGKRRRNQSGPRVRRRLGAYSLVVKTNIIPVDQDARDSYNGKPLRISLKIYTEASKALQRKLIIGVIGRGPELHHLDAVQIHPTDAAFGVNGEVYLAHFHQQESEEYAGLVNNGMTCYMNSLLQTLFQIKELPRQVFKLDYNTHKEKSGWGWVSAFQTMFLNMLTYKTIPAETRHLTEAFGWNTAEVFTQQDAQEFSCVLFDGFEKRCLEAGRPNFIKELFEGEMQNYIECKNVDYRSLREEKFYDIQLPVRGLKSVYESLDSYTAAEELTGDNQYAAGDYGKQDAVKGIRFKQLPSVLILHLRRFQFDFIQERNIKINSRHQLEESIDLRKYMAAASGRDDTNDPQKHQYELFGVLVHQGPSSGSGHYITFIRPELNQWYKFNDETVSRVSFEFVKSSSEGGDHQKFSVDPKTYESSLKSSSNNHTAYMLVYVKKSEAGSILAPISPSIIPKSALDDVRLLAKSRYREDYLAKNFQVYITASELLKGRKGAGALIDFKGDYDTGGAGRLKRDPQRRLMVVLERGCTVNELYDMISEKTGLAKGSFGLWRLNLKKNSLMFFTGSETEGRRTVKSFMKNQRLPVLLLEAFDDGVELFEHDVGEEENAGKKQSGEMEIENEKGFDVQSKEKDSKNDEDIPQNWLKGFLSENQLKFKKNQKLVENENSLEEHKEFTKSLIRKDRVLLFIKKFDDQAEIVARLFIDKEATLKQLKEAVEGIGVKGDNLYTENIKSGDVLVYAKIDLDDPNLKVKDFFSKFGVVIAVEGEKEEKFEEVFSGLVHNIIAKVEDTTNNSTRIIHLDGRKTTLEVNHKIHFLSIFSIF